MQDVSLQGILQEVTLPNSDPFTAQELGNLTAEQLSDPAINQKARDSLVALSKTKQEQETSAYQEVGERDRLPPELRKDLDESLAADKVADKAHTESDASEVIDKTLGSEGGSASTISPEMENKILFGERTNGNKLIGGHSSAINDSNPNYAVELISANTDGTKVVKFTTQFLDGNLAKIKTSTIFPESWSNNNIINSIKMVGDSTAIGVRDSSTLHRGLVNGVEIDVIKIGDTVISGYPTGGKLTRGFGPVK